MRVNVVVAGMLGWSLSDINVPERPIYRREAPLGVSPVSLLGEKRGSEVTTRFTGIPNMVQSWDTHHCTPLGYPPWYNPGIPSWYTLGIPSWYTLGVPSWYTLGIPTLVHPWDTPPWYTLGISTVVHP